MIDWLEGRWGMVWLVGGAVGICMAPGVARGFIYGDWTSAARIAAAVGVVAAVVAGAVAWRIWSASDDRRLGRRLRRLFEEYDLEVVDRDGTEERDENQRLRALGAGSSDAPEAVGSWLGRRVRVRRGPAGGDRSVYEVDVSSDVPEDLVVRRRSARTMEARFVGHEQFGAGCEPFREAYLVRARDVGRAERFLLGSGLDRLFADHLSDRAPEIRLEEGCLRLVRQSDPEDLRAVEAHLDRLHGALSALDEHLETPTG